MEMTGLKVGELDLLDGSPPCPPFSMSGTKQKGWGQENCIWNETEKHRRFNLGTNSYCK